MHHVSNSHASLLLPPHTTPQCSLRLRFLALPILLASIFIPLPLPIEVIKLRLHLSLAHKHPLPKPPRKLLSALERCVRARRYAENVVELFQRSLLRLVQEEEDKEESDDVQAGVKTEDAGTGEGGEHAWKRDGEDGAPKVCGGGYVSGCVLLFPLERGLRKGLMAHCS